VTSAPVPFFSKRRLNRIHQLTHEAACEEYRYCSLVVHAAVCKLQKKAELEIYFYTITFNYDKNEKM
jgi:hypothetical protein